MKPSDLTLEVVRAAIEKTAAPDWPGSRVLTTEDVLLVARGWDGRMRNWRPDTTGVQLVLIECRHDACEAAVRKHLAALAEQGLVWQSERGQRGYKWRWITDEDRRRDDDRARNHNEFLALAERIARRVGTEAERAAGDVRNHSLVSIAIWVDDGRPMGSVEVHMDRELATAFAEWLESRVPLVELPEVSDDDLRALAASLDMGDLHVAAWIREALDGSLVARRRCAYWIKTRGKDGNK